jgi:hypothetical protein
MKGLNRMSTLIIGQNYFGHGETPQEAKANWRKQHGGSRKLSDGYAIVEFPPGIAFSGVDEMGRFHWRYLTNDTTIEPTVTEVAPR